MMTIVRLALSSMRYRAVGVGTQGVAIMFALLLVFSVFRVQNSLESSVARALGPADIIVAPRDSDLNIVLYSALQVGSPRFSLPFSVYDNLLSHHDVEWAVPISLGDSVRGFRVVATNAEYFKRMGVRGRELNLSVGRSLSFDSQAAIVGARVAEKLDLEMDSSLVLSHGISEHSFHQHDDSPFLVKGVLEETETPVDDLIFVGLDAMTVLHESGASRGDKHGHDHKGHGHDHKGHGHDHKGHAHEPHHCGCGEADISAVFVGLKQKSKIFQFSHEIQQNPQHALSAAIPALAIKQIWKVFGFVEKVLVWVAVCVAAVIGFSILAFMVSSLQQRRREAAILRAAGAGVFHVSSLFILESLLLGGVCMLFAWGACQFFLITLTPVLEKKLGLQIGLGWISAVDVPVILGGFCVFLLSGLIPSIFHYFSSLHSGLGRE